MVNPVLVEVARGSIVESRHRGSVSIVDADGFTVLALGDVAAPIFPRSAVKLIQAIPLIESGAAEQYGLTDPELAIACASHNGELGHVTTVKSILSRVQFDASALQCGVHWPLHEPSRLALARSGAGPTAIHNNCSGQHAGFLCLAATMAVDPLGYIEATHPVQREVKSVLENLMEIELETFGIDGCSIPTFAVPLDRLAGAFARIGAGQRLGRERARACRHLLGACFSHPWQVGGTARFCTFILERLRDRAFVKMGAEGVFGAILPKIGLGVAIKCDDGGSRAAEIIMAALLTRLLPLSQDESAALEQFVHPPVVSCNNNPVGILRPAPALLTNMAKQPH